MKGITVKGDREKDEMLKISEVARNAGVSSQTIHYYMREGLLTKPLKTSRNMAYYSPVVIDEIRYIKELQKRYLPITVIKTMLEARREGQESGHVNEMQSLFEQIFQNTDTDMPGSLSLLELAEATGLEKDTIVEMQKMGILTPARSEDAGRFDRSDERIGKLVGRLLDLGLDTSDLAVFGQYLELIHKEVSLVRSKTLHSLHDGSITLTALSGVLNDLKNELDNKAFRQVFSKLRVKPDNEGEC